MYPTQQAGGPPAWPAARPAFFDPGRCPDCQAPLTGLTGPAADRRCPRCGLPLGGPAAVRLAESLTEADRMLEYLRRERAATTRQPAAGAVWTAGSPGAAAPGAVGGAGTAQAGAAAQAGGYPAAPVGGYPAAPVLRPAPRRLPALSGAVILLGLGGLCLVVAAIVFLSVSWTSLSLGAKVAVLAAVTGLLATAATEVTRRGLRGSAETLWAITFVDLALDVWAARRAGLARLDGVSAELYTLVAATGIALLALGCCLATRRSRLDSPLVSVQAVLGISGVVALSQGLADTALADWAAVSVGILVLVALAVAARGAGLTVAAWFWTLAATLLWLGLAITGLVQLALGKFVPEVWHGRAWELPMAALLALAIAAFEPVMRLTSARIVLTAGGLGLGSIMVAAIAEDSLPLPVALTAALLVMAALSWWRQPIWGPASGWVLTANLAVDALVVAALAAAGTGVSIQPRQWLWLRSATHHLPGRQPWPVLAELLLLAAVCLVLLARGRVLPMVAQPRWTVAVAGLLAVAVALNAHPGILVASVAWLVAATATAAVAWSADERLLAVPGVALLLGLLASLASDLASLVAFGAGALLTVAVRWRFAAAADRADPALLIAAELGAVGQLFVAVTAGWYRIQPGGATAAVVGLVVCAGVLGAVAALSPTRRWWVWLAFSALTVAIWIEAATHHLHSPEPYSLPSGALVLAFGVWAGRRTPDLSSWLAYGPGLLVLSAPTLVVALRDPLTWRAAAVGAAALAILLIGSYQRLQAPLLIGVAELTALVVRELGPYALALPRWVSIGTVGMLLLAIGITWESRLANLRQARHRLAGMR